MAPRPPHPTAQYGAPPQTGNGFAAGSLISEDALPEWMRQGGPPAGNNGASAQGGAWQAPRFPGSRQGSRQPRNRLAMADRLSAHSFCKIMPASRCRRAGHFVSAGSWRRTFRHAAGRGIPRHRTGGSARGSAGQWGHGGTFAARCLGGAQLADRASAEWADLRRPDGGPVTACRPRL